MRSLGLYTLKKAYALGCMRASINWGPFCGVSLIRIILFLHSETTYNTSICGVISGDIGGVYSNIA